MAKACLRCGHVNASNSKFCGKCGRALSPVKASGSSNYRFCKKCNRQVRVKGKTTGYFEPDSPVQLYWEEWEYYVLECNHIEFIRKTGGKKPPPELEL